MNFEILGLATATPALSITQSDAVTEAQKLCCETDQQRRLLQTLYRRSGVDKRYSVVLEAPDEGRVLGEGNPSDSSLSLECKQTSAVCAPSVSQSFFRPWYGGEDCGPSTSERMLMYEEHAPQLARQAVEAALADSNCDPQEITHLITVSCTGFTAPGVDLSLIRTCGLQSSVTRTHIGFMGCHGAINGLRVAQAYAASDPSARVLLCAVELCSLHQQYGWNRDSLVSNALFADGAAALIGRATSAVETRLPQLQATSSAVIPGTEDMMGWNIRDNGFQMYLSSEVPEIINRHLADWLASWLASFELQIGNIGSWAIHPGGPRILSACQDALGLSENEVKASHCILAEHGNMSSPTVLFILERLLQQNASLPCVTLAFGPGLSIEAALFA